MTFVLVRNIVDCFGEVARTGQKLILLIMLIILRKGDKIRELLIMLIMLIFWDFSPWGVGAQDPPLA